MQYCIVFHLIIPLRYLYIGKSSCTCMNTRNFKNTENLSCASTDILTPLSNYNKNNTSQISLNCTVTSPWFRPAKKINRQLSKRLHSLFVLLHLPILSTLQCFTRLLKLECLLWKKENIASEIQKQPNNAKTRHADWSEQVVRRSRLFFKKE